MRKSDWAIDDYIDKLRPQPREYLSRSFAKSSSPELRDKDVSDQMLQDCYVVMADIVNRYGEEYLPIFQRLHEEIESRRMTKELLDAALKATTGEAGPHL